MKSLKADLLRRVLYAISFVALFQWMSFVVYHVFEYLNHPELLWEEIEEILIIFGILSLGLPLMMYIIIRISRAVIQPLEDLSLQAAVIDPDGAEQIEIEDRYSEIQTLRLSFNNALQRYRGALDQARHFSGNASHQLRTPLAVVRSGCEVALSRPREPEEYQLVLTEVLEETARLETAIRQLQMLAFLNRGDVQKKEHVALSALLDSIKDRLQLMLEKKHIQLLCQVDEDSGFTGNASLMEEALFNLVENAVHASPENSTVEVSVKRQDARLMIDVVNSGPEIPREEQARIFDRFYRGAQDAYEGSGLGLPIAQTIVDLHHGTLSLESSAGKTCFRISLNESKGL